MAPQTPMDETAAYEKLADSITRFCMLAERLLKSKQIPVEDNPDTASEVRAKEVRYHEKLDTILKRVKHLSLTIKQPMQFSDTTRPAVVYICWLHDAMVHLSQTSIEGDNLPQLAFDVLTVAAIAVRMFTGLGLPLSDFGNEGSAKDTFSQCSKCKRVVLRGEPCNCKP